MYPRLHVLKFMSDLPVEVRKQLQLSMVVAVTRVPAVSGNNCKYPPQLARHIKFFGS